MRIEYLLFNLIIFLSPLIGVSLYRGARWPSLRSYGTGILLLSLPYLLWDHVVTDLWWSFNPLYTLGITIGKLPIEEILFFFVVPWSCLVIWTNLDHLVRGSFHFPIEIPLMAILAIGLVRTLQTGLWYAPMVIVVTLIITLASFFTTQVLRTKAYTLYLGFVSLMTLIFNSYLTARPVVIYAQDQILGIRIGTIPIEDFFYGIALLSGFALIDTLWSHWQGERRDKVRQSLIGVTR